MILPQIRQRLEQEKGALRAIREACSTCNFSLQALRKEFLVIEEAGLVLQHVAKFFNF